MDSKKLAELHVHLEGCVWETHINRWWKNSEFLFPPPKLFYRNRFEKFLAHLRFRYNFLNTPLAYAEVMKDYVLQAMANNIVYAEVLINIALIETWFLNLQDVLSEINKKINEINNCPVIRFIIDIPWQFTKNNYESLFEDVDNLKCLGVVAIGLGGDEKQADIKTALKLFSNARNVGLSTICHAGEITDYQFAIRIVENLKPDRIVHGISIANWIGNLGPKSPPVDVCFSSNILLNNIGHIQNHPFWSWINSGVPINVSTDDPAIFDTSLQKELHIASKEFKNFDMFFSKIDENSLKAAFDKESLLYAMEKYNK